MSRIVPHDLRHCLLLFWLAIWIGGAPVRAESYRLALHGPYDPGSEAAIDSALGGENAKFAGEAAISEPSHDEAEEPDTDAADEATAEDLCESDDEGEDKPVIADFAKALIVVSADRGNITFIPGLRLQPRFAYDDFTNNSDFLIRRTRFKAGGEIFDFARYGAEIKFDSTGQFEREASGSVENAWVDFEAIPDVVYFRAGLEDLPFSRDAMTSDSKLLFMDRSLIKDELTEFGLADNGIGILFHGRPWGGYLEYCVGLFDDVEFERLDPVGIRDSDHLLPIGRIALHLLDPAEPPHGYADYMGSYIGKGSRLSIGANAAYLHEAFEGPTVFDLYGWGVDIFFNHGRYVFQAEYDQFTEDLFGSPDFEGDGWYAQGGYLVGCLCGTQIEMAARYQELDPDKSVFDDYLRWTTLGMNFYIHEHNLKVQTDYTMRGDSGFDFEDNVVQVQLQLDY